jgi:hypothetical protein
VACPFCSSRTIQPGNQVVHEADYALLGSPSGARGKRALTVIWRHTPTPPPAAALAAGEVDW